MRIALLLLALPLAACAGGGPMPDASARLSTAPDAPGYVVIGFAEQNYRLDFGTQTKALTVAFTGAGREPVAATRKGCTSFNGFFGTKTCDLTIVERQVLQVQPGEWTLSDVSLDYYANAADHTLRAKIAPPVVITVKPGEVVYAGDYIFASDADTNTIRLAQRARDDAGAQRALAPYRGLREAPVAYRGAGS